MQYSQVLRGLICHAGATMDDYTKKVNDEIIWKMREYINAGYRFKEAEKNLIAYLWRNYKDVAGKYEGMLKKYLADNRSFLYIYYLL